MALTIDVGADTANGQPLSIPRRQHEEQVGCFSSSDTIVGLFAEKTLPQGCHAYQVHAAKGEVGFSAICSPDEDDVSIDMTGAGHFTENQLSMRIDARAESNGDQANMSGTLLATRLGNCPAEH